jgi:transcriptional regulator with XRE-family HTH domain
VHLGTVIQEKRQHRGETQEQLAERANLSPKYLGQIERGEVNLTIDALARIASALEWNPWRWFKTAPPSISKEAHALLADLTSGRQRLRGLIDWLEGIHPAERREISTSGQTNDERGSR